ncbi:MAG: type II toxin-antitoxin system HicB family antitoxin, partial [Acidimicrobiales bacterium]
MSKRKTYVAVYERDTVDDAWNVRVDGLEGCQTYGRSLRQAQARIREALAVWLDRDPTALVIEDRVPAKLAAVAKRAQKARDDAERAGAKAQEQVAGAAKELT